MQRPSPRMKLQVRVFAELPTHTAEGEEPRRTPDMSGNSSVFPGAYSFGMVSPFGLGPVPLAKRLCCGQEQLITSACPKDSGFTCASKSYGRILHQFLLVTNPYDNLRDLRRQISEQYKKLYPLEAKPDFSYLRDINDCDLDDDFVAGEIFEPNDVVVVMNKSKVSDAHGVMTPDSLVTAPLPESKVEIAVPTPKMAAAPFGKTFGKHAQDLSSSSNETFAAESMELHHEASANESEPESGDESKSESEEKGASGEGSEECEFEEESESESDSNSESSGEDSISSSIAQPQSAMLTQNPALKTVDDRIAFEIVGESSSEFEVEASSTESESESGSETGSESESESEAETKPEAKPSPAVHTNTAAANQISPESEEEECSEEEASTSESESSSADESSTEDSSSGSEESESEQEELATIQASSCPTPALGESEVSSNESDSESDEENAAPPAPSNSNLSTLDLPITTSDVKQALKEVPKYTSLRTLKDCLSQAVSGRATPLLPQESAPPASQPVKKGRVTLPRRRKNAATGYDPSLFS